MPRFSVIRELRAASIGRKRGIGWPDFSEKINNGRCALLTALNGNDAALDPQAYGLSAAGDVEFAENGADVEFDRVF